MLFPTLGWEEFPSSFERRSALQAAVGATLPAVQTILIAQGLARRRGFFLFHADA
jgi:hypothetical protein